MADHVTAGHRGPGLNRRQVLAGSAALGAAAAVGGLAPGALAQGKIKLTVWAWTPKTQELANLYTKKNPNVEVVVENVGQGAPHYVKLRNAITAGTGLPDLGQVEFNSIRSFRALDALADIGKDGANAVKGEFVDWTWSAVSDGDAVYGMPWDSGPMATLYRADVYEKHGLKPAETWDEFSEQALKLAKDAPGTFLTDFANDSGWTAAVLWQAGWRPFKTDGAKIQIRINDDIAKKWANYWQKLIDAKAVDTKPGWTSEWFAAFDDGTYAAWVTAGWAPVLMQQAMKKSFGKWRAAPMPQWEKGGKVTSNWGGSTFAAFKTTPYPKEAADLAVFLTTDPEVARKWNTEAYLFPVLKSLLADKDLMGHKYDFYGGQAVNEIFAASAAEVDPSFQFAPFQDYVNSQIEDNFAAAVAGKGTLAEAFDKVQETVVAYATDQGFEVT